MSENFSESVEMHGVPMSMLPTERLTELERRPTWDEFYEWLSGAYAAGWTMGTSGVPTEMRETLAHNHAQDAVLAMQQKREKE